MPRPSKHVSPDTLGGRIRAAREHLQLSLAEVANGHYSTSLISQIERNRVDPSHESLRFLADRLQLPLEDLEMLAQQHRETEIEARQYRSFDELRKEAARLLAQNEICRATNLLNDMYFPRIPSPQRWRLAALRGQCYYEQRKFLKAQQDFLYAVSEHPNKLDGLPQEQRHELMLLHLHLAGTYRALQQLDEALEEYSTTLQIMNSATPFGYVAEAHWGIALIAFAQACSLRPDNHHPDPERNKKLQLALEHAENARFLYRAIGEQLRAASVTCQIAEIERMMGSISKVHSYLDEVLSTWAGALEKLPATPPAQPQCQQEIASVISAAACTLAGLELEARQYKTALHYIDQALDVAQHSYPLRRADAYLMRGRILEAMDPQNPEAEDAFRHATRELAGTQRIAARISAHVRLGRHLLKIGKIAESEQELDQARLLSDLVSAGGSTMSRQEPIL